MSGGTADGGKDAKETDAKGLDAGLSDAKVPDAKDSDIKASGVGSDAEASELTSPGSGAGARQSEWTVSDHRGPLRAPSEVDGIVDEGSQTSPGGEVAGAGASVPRAGDHPASTLSDDVTASADAPRPADGLGHVGAAPEPPVAGKRSVLPVAAAVVIGSLIGGGSAALVYNLRHEGPAVPPEVSGRLAAVSSRLDAVEKRPDPTAAVAAVRREVEALAGRVSSLEKRPAAAAQPAATPPASANAPANAPAKSPAANGELADKVATLEGTVAAIGKQDGSRQAAIKETIKDLAGKLDALQGTLAQLQASARSDAEAAKGQQRDLDGKIAALQTAVGGAQRQASAVQSDLSAVQSEQKTLAGKVAAPALAVAADSLVAQVEAGKPFRPQVDALASLGADPARLAVLRGTADTGVPSAQALAASFAPLADPVIATGTKASPGAAYGEQLKQGLLGLVNMRRADGTAGNDLASRVALIQADLAHGDVGGAYGVFAALPADAKAKAGAWGAQLKSSADALVAARGLQTQSIDTLAAKKS